MCQLAINILLEIPYNYSSFLWHMVAQLKISFSRMVSICELNILWQSNNPPTNRSHFEKKSLLKSKKATKATLQSPQGVKKKKKGCYLETWQQYLLVSCQIIWLYTKQKATAKWNRIVSYFRMVSRMGLRRKKKNFRICQNGLIQLWGGNLERYYLVVDMHQK